ncbi:MATE efflux family protein DTX1 [Hordeum vulgare]|nr:MATE efflux family protein DTX1 [Hordeum vulgare]
MAQGGAGDLGLGAELPRGGEIQTGPGRRRRMSSVDAAGNPLRAFTSATSLLFRTLGPTASPSRSPGALLGGSLVQLSNLVLGVLGAGAQGGPGSKGAALASAVSYSTNLAILCLYTRLSGACRRTWTRFSMEAFAFKELRQFAELAIPSAVMVCLEWRSFELLVLLSGLLPNPKLETFVLSICLNTGALMFTVPSGLCAAISTRVSNELGAGRPQVARLTTIVVICMARFAGSVISITMILLSKSWGYMYSNEEEVVSYIARMIPVLGVSFFIDGIHTSLSGLVVSICLGGAFFACLFSGSVADGIGRRRAFQLSALPMIMGAALICPWFNSSQEQIYAKGQTFLAHADNGH